MHSGPNSPSSLSGRAVSTASGPGRVWGAGPAVPSILGRRAAAAGAAGSLLKASKGCADVLAKLGGRCDQKGCCQRKGCSFRRPGRQPGIAWAVSGDLAADHLLAGTARNHSIAYLPPRSASRSYRSAFPGCCAVAFRLCCACGSLSAPSDRTWYCRIGRCACSPAAAAHRGAVCPAPPCPFRPPFRCRAAWPCQPLGWGPSDHEARKQQMLWAGRWRPATDTLTLRRSTRQAGVEGC